MLQGHLTVKIEQLQSQTTNTLLKKSILLLDQLPYMVEKDYNHLFMVKYTYQSEHKVEHYLTQQRKKESRLIYLNIPLQQSNLLLSIPLHSTLDLKLGRSLMVIKLHYLIMKLRLEFWGLSINTIVKRNQQGLTDVLTNLRINR